jgi:choline transport protein
MLAFLVLAMTFNNWGSKTLPALQTFALFAHMFGWALVLISLLVSNGGHFNSPSSVFTNAEVHSGWKNLGVACLISQVGV